MFPKLPRTKKSIYLDYAATTPLDPRVEKVMRPFWISKFGNPSSLYRQGREARQAIEESRKSVADLIGARPNEIIFTAGGTESVNLAIFGVARMNTNLKTDKHGPRHLIASAIEHHCVLNSFKALKEQGLGVTLAPVDSVGRVSMDKLKSAVRPETIFISVMLANNEIGTIEPIAEIGKWVKKINAERLQNGLPRILFHTDACQAAGVLDLNVDRLGIDLMSVNGGKIYGPKQTGCLYIRSGIKLKPLVFGGGQESDLRSGTENVPGIVGFAKALELAQDLKARELENRRISSLQSYLISQINKKITGVLLNGPENGFLKGRGLKQLDTKANHFDNNLKRLPNNINFSIRNVEGESLMLYLDAYGISASTASACSTGSLDPSHVLLAIGRSQPEAKNSIRFSLGKSTTKKDLDYVLKILPDIVDELRKVK